MQSIHNSKDAQTSTVFFPLHGQMITGCVSEVSFLLHSSTCPISERRGGPMPSWAPSLLSHVATANTYIPSLFTTVTAGTRGAPMGSTATLFRPLPPISTTTDHKALSILLILPILAPLVTHISTDSNKHLQCYVPAGITQRIYIVYLHALWFTFSGISIHQLISRRHRCRGNLLKFCRSSGRLQLSHQASEVRHCHSSTKKMF